MYIKSSSITITISIQFPSVPRYSFFLREKKKEFNYPEKSDSSIGEKEFNSGSIEQ